VSYSKEYGREWMGSPSGQAWIARMLVILIHNNHSYESCDELISDLISTAADGDITVTSDDIRKVLDMAVVRLSG
jgi:hypothetical protein